MGEMTRRGKRRAAPGVEPAGARESNAGDEFHILWALRRALLMLSPASELRAVRLEGVSPLDPASSEMDQLQGVDLTEYYGGMDSGSAARVILSQLKYSQRHPEKAGPPPAWPKTALVVSRGSSGAWPKPSKRSSKKAAAKRPSVGSRSAW